MIIFAIVVYVLFYEGDSQVYFRLSESRVTM